MRSPASQLSECAGGSAGGFKTASYYVQIQRAASRMKAGTMLERPYACSSAACRRRSRLRREAPAPVVGRRCRPRAPLMVVLLLLLVLLLLRLVLVLDLLSLRRATRDRRVLEPRTLVVLPVVRVLLVQGRLRRRVYVLVVRVRLECRAVSLLVLAAATPRKERMSAVA